MGDENKEAMEVLIEAMLTGNGSQAIVNQEARGQQTLVNSEQLPLSALDYKTELEAVGFKFGEPIDEWFVSCQLPDGWTKQAIDHHMWSNLLDHMWSNLLDDQERTRASIGYKAAFYDKWTKFNPITRFSVIARPVNGDYDAPNETTPYEAIVKDGDVIMSRTPGVFPSDDVPWFKLEGVVYPAAERWLAERYPDWRNPFAYWDEA